jgi:hypothetical protein
MITFATILQSAKGIAPLMGTMALSLALLAGCSTSGRKQASDTVTVTMTQEGTVEMSGERIELSRLPRAIKSRGATSRTAIKVVVPEDVSATRVKKMNETLVAGGYPRIIFTKPLKATTEKRKLR